MANTFLTAKQIVAGSVGLLVRSLVLPMTVFRVADDNFTGANGDTVTVRVPVAMAARQQTPGAEITYDSINETPVDVTVTHLYSAVKLTDEDLSLNLEDFARQVLGPQIAAIAEGAEDTIAAVMNDLDADDTIAPNGADIEDKILIAREALSAQKVPAGDRFLAVSPQVTTFLLKLRKVSEADAAGSTSALRDALIGRFYGFTVVESSALTEGTAVAYHRTSFAFANKVPVVPPGVVDGGTLTSQGIGLRWIRQYVPNILSEASVHDTFAGAALVDRDRCVKLMVGST